MIDVMIQIVCVLVVAGVVLWAVSQFPLDATIAKLIKVVVVVCSVVYLLRFLTRIH